VKSFAVADDELVDAVLLPSDSLGSLMMNTHAPWIMRRRMPCPVLVIGCANWRSMRIGQQRENMRALSPGHFATDSAHDACGQ
jgi:hypothetical protein